MAPRSTKSTNLGQAALVTSTPSPKDFSYAPLLIVAMVPITPTRPERVASVALRTAGWITSTTGISYRSLASVSMAALALLQAMTSILTPSATSWSRHSRANARISGIGRGPYGVRAVSPR